MFKNSLTNGALDEKKVKKIITEITKSKIRGLAGILKIYKKLVERKISIEEITVEVPIKVAFSKKTLASLLEKTGAKKVNLRENPALVLGARIIHGDWVYDSTLDAKLEQFKKQL